MPRSLGAVTIAILEAIRDGHRYGADVMDATGRTGGTVYKVLRRLEHRGWISGEWEEAEVALAERRPRRRFYTLTSGGHEALVEAVDRLRAGSDLATDES